MPLNLITCTVLYCLHKNDGSSEINDTSQGDQNAFLFNIVMGLIGVIAAIFFRKFFAVEKKLDDDNVLVDSKISEKSEIVN